MAVSRGCISRRDSSNLNLSFSGGTEKSVFVKNMKEKCVTFCFIILNANRFLQNHWGKGDISVQKLGLFFQS